MTKVAFFELLVSPKLISRKIWVTEKLWNFHTVQSHLGMFRIFPPFRFYVKSILVILKPILTIWAALNIEFLGTFDIFKSEILLKIKIQSLQIVKGHFLTLWNQPKLISCKIRVGQCGKTRNSLSLYWQKVRESNILTKEVAK